MATIIDGTYPKYVKADIEVHKYGFLINGWHIHQENGGVVVEKDTERYYYTNISLAVKHCLLDDGWNNFKESDASEKSYMWWWDLHHESMWWTCYY